uniref:Uncharacterized protein n=1 Tax=Salix viminalis TaxID=40686 RepID=A0A6N2LTN7_SALVM
MTLQVDRAKGTTSHISVKPLRFLRHANVVGISYYILYQTSSLTTRVHKCSKFFVRIPIDYHQYLFQPVVLLSLSKGIPGFKGAQYKNTLQFGVLMSITTTQLLPCWPSNELNPTPRHSHVEEDLCGLPGEQNPTVDGDLNPASDCLATKCCLKLLAPGGQEGGSSPNFALNQGSLLLVIGGKQRPTLKLSRTLKLGACPGSVGEVFCRGHEKNNHNLAGTHHHRHLATTTPLANNQQHPSEI